jgi:sporulation protein YlmC with PRC-barrel domain
MTITGFVFLKAKRVTADCQGSFYQMQMFCYSWKKKPDTARPPSAQNTGVSYGTGVAFLTGEMKEENVMDNLLKKKLSKGVTTVGVAAALALVAPSAYLQAAASKTLSVSQQEMNLAEKGWSGKKDIMGKAVYNDNNEKIGDVNDVIFSRNNTASFVVIGVGGFLGMGEHDVAVPLSRIKHDNDKLILAGATKEALKSMPEFKYAKSEGTDKSSTRK